ncbi:hypothetical protein [Nocardia sp. X0981]
MTSETATITPDPTAVTDHHAADLRWPDPSPLHDWWTEVMDGALLPRATE